MSFHSNKRVYESQGFHISLGSSYLKENLESEAGHGCATKISLRA